MLSKAEIKKWLLENCVNTKGDLILSGLDFSDFDGNVFISGMKVKKDLWQNFQTVGQDLWQNFQTVGRNLFQGYQTVGKDLLQDPKTEDIKSVKEWLSLLKKSGVNSKQQVIKQMEMWLKKEE